MSEHDQPFTAVEFEKEILSLVYSLCKVASDQIAQHPNFKRTDDLSVCSTLAVAFMARAFVLAPEGTHNTLTNTIVSNASTFTDLILNEKRQDVIDAWIDMIIKQCGVDEKR